MRFELCVADSGPGVVGFIIVFLFLVLDQVLGRILAKYCEVEKVIVLIGRGRRLFIFLGGIKEF